MLILSGCASRQVDMSQLRYPVLPPPVPVQDAPAVKAPPARPQSPFAVSKRVVTAEELYRLAEKDPKLGYYDCLNILARINKKDARYIKEDIAEKRPLYVPVDFSAFKTWTPLPRVLPGQVGVDKLILVVKDIPFVGWYEQGRLKGDSLTCVGKEWNWTEKGIYKVLQKDPDHYSKSYTNAFGEPAWMPMALRIYGTVWIHAGDVVGAYCSHGCINLPPDPAERLYNWADVGTTVVVSDFLKDVNQDLIKLYKPELREPVLIGPGSDRK